MSSKYKAGWLQIKGGGVEGGRLQEKREGWYKARCGEQDDVPSLTVIGWCQGGQAAVAAQQCSSNYVAPLSPQAS
jgi:hypothetical protein